MQSVRVNHLPARQAEARVSQARLTVPSSAGTVLGMLQNRLCRLPSTGTMFTAPVTEWTIAHLPSAWLQTHPSPSCPGQLLCPQDPKLDKHSYLKFLGERKSWLWNFGKNKGSVLVSCSVAPGALCCATCQGFANALIPQHPLNEWSLVSASHSHVRQVIPVVSSGWGEGRISAPPPRPLLYPKEEATAVLCSA